MGGSPVRRMPDMDPVADGGLAQYVRDWRPAPVTTTDLIGPAPAAALAAVLDDPVAPPGDGDALPPLWHWLYFLDWAAQRDLGADGHPRHGAFLPPLPTRRRMFAGGRLQVSAPLLVGAPAQRRSSLVSAQVKQGRSGELLFTTVRHEISRHGIPCLVEEQDLVYRSGDAPASPGGAAVASGADGGPRSTAPWQAELRPDPVLLFRFSALTANAHRIHYDDRYTRDVEHYPGLVVHGPLLVLAMLQLVREHRPDRTVDVLDYRLRRPVFAGDPILVTGTPDGDGAVELAVLGADGEPRASGRAELGWPSPELGWPSPRRG